MLAAVTNAEQEQQPQKERSFKSLVQVDKSVAHLYRVIHKSTGSVGGYGHNGPIYGEITVGTFQKVVDALAEHTGFDASSSFVDIGSGLGKPNLHVALNPGVQLSYGVELEQLRYQLSMHNLRFVMKEVPEMRKSVVYFGHDDATNMVNFEPFTHVYMFDVGFPPSVLVSLANAFNMTKCVKALVSFQKPDRVIGRYGFNVELIKQITTRMNGSNETHTAYIYGAKAAKATRQLQISFPRDSPVKKASQQASNNSTSPVKKKEEKKLNEEESCSSSSPVKATKPPASTPLKLKLRGAKKLFSSSSTTSTTTEEELVVKCGEKNNNKTSSSSPSKTQKKGSALLAQLQSEDYSFWVNNTGVIGGESDGKRPQRTRKQVDLKKM